MIGSWRIIGEKPVLTPFNPQLWIWKSSRGTFSTLIRVIKTIHRQKFYFLWFSTFFPFYFLIFLCYRSIRKTFLFLMLWKHLFCKTLNMYLLKILTFDNYIDKYWVRAVQSILFRLLNSYKAFDFLSINFSFVMGNRTIVQSSKLSLMKLNCSTDL